MTPNAEVTPNKSVEQVSHMKVNEELPVAAGGECELVIVCPSFLVNQLHV